MNQAPARILCCALAQVNARQPISGIAACCWWRATSRGKPLKLRLLAPARGRNDCIHSQVLHHLAIVIEGVR
jgi:hypothetical protein